MKLNVVTIRIEMAKRNLNQSELAKCAGIERSTLCMIMQGKSIGRPDTWQKIADSMGLNVKEILEY